MNSSNPVPAAIVPAVTNGRITRLVLGLLPLVLAGFVGFVMSAFLLMGSGSCMADSAPLICSPVVQQWIGWLPPMGAGLGVAAGGTLGAVLIARGRSVGAALGLGWTVFAVAELGVLILLRA